MDRTGARWPDLLPCTQVTSEAAETFILVGLEVLERLERRAEALSSHGGRLYATLVVRVFIGS